LDEPARGRWLNVVALERGCHLAPLRPGRKEVAMTATLWEQRAVSAARRPACWLAVAAMLLALQVKWWWQPCPDALSYLSIARHMAHGELQLLGSPHVRMAPGYPLLIAPAFLLSDRPFLIIAIIHFALALAFMAAVYVWFRRVAGSAAAPLTALVMCCACLWQYYRYAVSELAFMAALMWAAYALDRLLRAATRRQVAVWAAASVGLTVMAAFTRQVGVLLLCGFAAALLVRALRGEIAWRRAVGLAALVGAPVSAAVLALVGWDHAMAQRAGDGAKSYAQYLAADHMTPLQQVVEGIRLRTSESRLVIPGMYKAYARTGQWLNPLTPFYLVVSTALAWAWWKKARELGDLLLYTLPAYVALYVVWPFDQGGRYMLPMLPVLVLCLWALLERLPQWRFTALLALVAAHAAASLVYWARDLQFAQYHRHWPEVARLAEPLRCGPNTVGWCDPDDLPQLKGYKLMLAYEINRPLTEVAAHQPMGPRVRWLVAPWPPPEVEGFVPRTAAGALALLERANGPVAALADDGGPREASRH
jgi:hypothetical protein